MASTSEPKAQAMIEPKIVQPVQPSSDENKAQNGNKGIKEEDVVLHTENSESPVLPAKSRVTRYVSKINVIDDLERPDYDLLMKRMDEIHARNDRGEPYSWGETCCGATTGWHCCFGTTKKSDFDKFGVGVVHYFRFVKYLICFFFIASIMAIPSLYFAIESADAFSTDTLMSYKGMLYFTTMGSIASASAQCISQPMDITGLTTITFTCPTGRIGKIANLDYGRIIEKKSISCDAFSAYSWDKECNDKNTGAQELKEQYDSNCFGKKTCNFVIKRSYFDFENGNCDEWDPLSLNYNDKTKGFYFSVLCQDIEMELPGGKKIEKETVGWIIASIDTAICLLYLLFLIALERYEKQAVNNVTGNNDAIDTYTIQIRTLPTMTMSELRAKLWAHFSSVEVEGKSIKVNVVDVQLAESNVLLKLNQNLGALREKKVRMYREFYTKWSKGSPILLEEVGYDDLYKLATENGKKALKDFKPIQKLKAKQEKLQAKIVKMRNFKKSDIVSAFITFEDKKQRDMVYSYHQSSPLSRFCFPVCCCGYENDPNVFEKSYLHVVDAPIPSNIIWANMGVSRLEKFFRRLLSWAITIALWAISFGFMILVRNKQNEAAETVKPTKDCTGLDNLTEDDVLTDTTGALGYVECYCRADFARALQESVCHDWTIDKLMTEGLPFLVVFAIIIINYILQVIFRLLTSFERHRSSSTESVSRILKIFIAQALNTGIIILLVNAKVANHNASKVLAGTFDDVNAQWYLDVGTTLLTTMIINVISLPVINTLMYLGRSCSRCWDRGCSCDKHMTRQRTQTNWERLYTGPDFLIEFRYAQILTVVFICMFYSSGIPLLFISTFLNLIAFYWTDKIYILKICKLPKALDKKLQSLVRKTLFFAVLLHLGKAVWVYGNPKIFGDSKSLKVAQDFYENSNGDEAPGVFTTLYNRAIIEHNLSLACLFVLVVFLIVAWIFFQNTVKKIFTICLRRKGKKTKGGDKYKNINPYYGRIKYDDLVSEKRFLEKEIATIRYEKLKELLEQRLQRIEAELELRNGTKENSRDKFQGIFSYSINHHPAFKRYFGAKGLLDSASPEMQ